MAHGLARDLSKKSKSGRYFDIGAVISSSTVGDGVDPYICRSVLLIVAAIDELRTGLMASIRASGSSPYDFLLSVSAPQPITHEGPRSI